MLSYCLIAFLPCTVLATKVCQTAQILGDGGPVDGMPPLDTATVLPVSFASIGSDHFRATSSLYFTTENDFAESAKSFARESARYLFPSNATHEFTTSIFQNLSHVQLGEMSFVSALWNAVHHHEAARLLLFFGQMMAPACLMPIIGVWAYLSLAGWLSRLKGSLQDLMMRFLSNKQGYFAVCIAATLMVLRMKFGLLGARFQRYNVRLYRALWLLLLLLLMGSLAVLFVTIAIVTAASSGLIRSFNHFSEVTEDVLSDFQVSASSIRGDLHLLKNTSVRTVEESIERHMRAMPTLITQAVWMSVPVAHKASVLALDRIDQDVSKAQAELHRMNKDLGIVANLLDGVKVFFLKQKHDLEAFKDRCTIPLLCKRIDGNVLIPAVDTRQLSIESTVRESKIVDTDLPVQINQSCALFCGMGGLLEKTRKTDSKTFLQNEFKTWKAEVQAFVEPVMDLSLPLVKAIGSVSTAYHEKHYVAGVWNYHVLYGIIAAAVLLAAVAALWSVGLLCGCCYYQTIVLPLSRSLDSDCAGLVLMGVTYFSLLISPVMILMAVAIVIAGTIGGGTICPLLQTKVYDQAHIDQVISALIEQKPTNWTYNRTLFKNDSSIGLALHGCSANPNSTLLDLFHFPKNTASQELVADKRTKSQLYFFTIYKITAKAEASRSFSDLAVEALIQEFYPSALDDLIKKYQKTLSVGLEPQKAMLRTSTETKVIRDAILELRKIGDGLVSKPGEQNTITRLVNSLNYKYTDAMGQATDKAHKILHQMAAFTNEIEELKDHVRHFLKDKDEVKKYAGGDLKALTKKKVELFRQRVMSYLTQYTDYFYKESTTRVGRCEPFLIAMKTWRNFVCDIVIGDLLLLGFGLIGAVFAFVPACVISVVLSRQLLILKESDHAEDHYEVTVPADVRKRPKPLLLTIDV